MKTNLYSHPKVIIPDYADYHRSSQKEDPRIEVLDFLEETENGRFVISLHSDLFSSSQPQVLMTENNVVLFVNEKVEENCEETMFISDWQGAYSKPKHKTRTMSMDLPNDDYYLVQEYVLPESSIFRIILGKSDHN
jgi:hypothetical protein